MTRSELLRELEALPHGARMRRMFEVGAALSQDASLEQILSELENGGTYERALALQSCFGSRDGARALRALEDASRALRGLAKRLCVLCCDDAQLQSAIENATGRDRQKLIKLARPKRRAAIDAFLQTLLQRDDPAFERLLPHASEAFARGHADRLHERGGSLDWARLSKHHPQVAGESLLRAAQNAQQLDARLVWRAKSALAPLCDRSPDDALALVRELNRFVPMAQLPLQVLAQRRPNEVAAWLLQTQDAANVNFVRVPDRLSDETRAQLLELRPDVLPGFAWLKRLSAQQRREAYMIRARGWRDANGALSHGLLAQLPTPERQLEARRCLELPALQTRPLERLQYAGLLPYEEAHALLDRFVRDPDPILRALALGNLAYSVRFERSRVPDFLQMVLARKNEQDPIRGAILLALSQWPRAVWDREHLDELGQILRQALDAADLSPTTASYGERLVLALLPAFPDWAASWLATLVRERGTISFFNLQHRLTEADVRAIAPTLWPVVQSWETRERERAILGLAGSLGRRLKVWDDLVELLERLMRSGLAATASASLSIVACHRRDRLPILVPALLQLDKSWITQAPVYNFVHRSRQDLLNDFLGRQTYSGRFSTGRTYFVLPFTEGFHRWLPTQQELFAETLRIVIGDEARDTPALLQVITQLSALPDVPPRQLKRLADARNPKLVTRDAALRALAKRDNGDGVAALLEAMSDDRARIAIYALRRALTEMPPTRALEVLRSMPLERVTVAKEVVRLVGDLKTPQAYEVLLDFSRRELHRDVRVALLRAFWEFLERDETWPILESAATSPDASVASGVVRIPAERLSPTSARRLAGLLATLLRHPDAKVRLDALLRCASLPLSDDEGVLWTPLLNALGSVLPDECAWASRAILATYFGRQADLVGVAAARVLTNRRALQTFVDQLRVRAQGSRALYDDVTRAVVNALQNDPLTSGLRVELALAGLPTRDAIAQLQELAARDELHAGTQTRAQDALSMWTKQRRPDDLELLETAFAASSDARLRRLALAALLAVANTARGWSDERVARLQTFRADSSPLVAEAAQFCFVPGETS